LVETHRRGLATAGEVASVSDGAEWIQGLVDFHRPDAVRILDLPHAAEHLYGVGQTLYGEGSPRARAWLKGQVEGLKAEGPGPMLEELRELVPDGAAGATHRAYLERREAQMQYPHFQAAGWPIGSGMVESANKLVVEDRLKGSGMHWAREHVNPMLALRNIVASDRWDEGWAAIEAALRQEAWRARQARQHKHREPQETMGNPQGVDAADEAPHVPQAPEPAIMSPAPPPALPEVPPATTRRPAADHPWRHSPVGKARYRPWKPYDPPKS
jgi:hypothetical protein